MGAGSQAASPMRLLAASAVFAHSLARGLKPGSESMGTPGPSRLPRSTPDAEGRVPRPHGESQQARHMRQCHARDDPAHFSCPLLSCPSKVSFCQDACWPPGRPGGRWPRPWGWGWGWRCCPTCRSALRCPGTWFPVCPVLSPTMSTAWPLLCSPSFLPRRCPGRSEFSGRSLVQCRPSRLRSRIHRSDRVVFLLFSSCQ